MNAEAPILKAKDAPDLGTLLDNPKVRTVLSRGSEYDM